MRPNLQWALRSPRLTLPTLKIRMQIIMPFLLLMLILGVVGTYLTTTLVASSIENRLADQLVHSQDAALDAAVKLQGRQVAVLRLIANTEGVDQAVRSGDGAALRKLLIPIEVNNRLGTIAVFDASGRTLLQIDQPDSNNPAGLVFTSGADLSSNPVVAPVLRGAYDSLGDKYLGYVGAPPRALAAAGPIVFGDHVVGGAMLQMPLGALLAEMQTKSQAQVVLVDTDGHVIGTTRAGITSDVIDDHTRSYLALASPGRASRRSVTVQGQPYEIQFTLFYLRQRPVGYLGVAVSRQAVIQAGLHSALQMSVLFASVVLLLLVIGYLLALRLTRPIEDLVAGTQAVARGDLSKRLQVRRQDELGELAGAFNTMTQDLQDRTRALNEQMSRLAALYQTSQGLGRETEPGAMAEVILGISLKALGMDKALLLARTPDGGGLDVRAVLGLPTQYTGQLLALNGPRLADGFATESTATIETVTGLGQDSRRCLRLFSELGDVQQALVVPLVRGERNAGYLVAGVARDYALPQQDVELLKTIATEMALMLENADLRKKTQLQAHRLDQAITALEKISQALTAVTVGTDNLLRAVAHATAEILDVPYASIHLRKSSWREEFTDVIVRCTTRRELAAVRLTGELVTQRVERPEQVLELDLENQGSPLAPARRIGLQRVIGVPMCLAGEVVGVLAIHMRTPRSLERSEVRVLQTLANQAVIAIENAAAYEHTRQLATTDSVTGVANHRELEAYLDRELTRARKLKEPLALIICDLDHFKEINDTVGHPAGDAVLRHLTRQILVPAVRPKDLVARYGGDEFVLVLRGADGRAAIMVAERIRKAVSGQAVLHDGKAVANLSLSLGIAVFPRDGETRESLVQAADQALYVAKRTGRNRVVRSDTVAGDTQQAA